MFYENPIAEHIFPSKSQKSSEKLRSVNLSHSYNTQLNGREVLTVIKELRVRLPSRTQKPLFRNNEFDKQPQFFVIVTNYQNLCYFKF